MLQRLRGYHWWNEWGEFQEYQTQLIDSVKEDIKRLHDRVGFIAGCSKRFLARRDSDIQFKTSEAYHVSQMHDYIPPCQIEHQLLTYTKRVEDVLGKGWEFYAEGQIFQSENASFHKKLDTRPVYDAWLHDINRRHMGVNGRLSLFVVGVFN
jgi:dynein heavy chain 1